MQINERVELVVRFNYMKRLNELQNYGFVHHISHEHQYAIIYVDERIARDQARRLNSLRMVKSVQISPRHQFTNDFSTVLDPLKESEENDKHAVPLKYRF